MRITPYMAKFRFTLYRLLMEKVLLRILDEYVNISVNQI